MRFIRSSALVALIFLVFTGSAAAQETLSLDTHSTSGGEAAGPVATTAALTAGAQYYVTVKGTMSIWPTTQWSSPGSTCGASETTPVTPSPGVANGPTGWDAETVYAVPPGVSFNGFTCDPAQIPFHSLKQSPQGFQIDSGAGFAHMEPVGGARTTPRADHTYTYAITGQGAPLALRFVDSPLHDNYGVFTINVLTAGECAAQNCLSTAGTSGDSVGSPPNSTSIVLAPSRSCSSRRRFRVHFRTNKGVKVKTASARVNTRFYKVIRNPRTLQSFVDLRGLPKGTFTLRVRATTTRHQVLMAHRTYHTCIPKIVKRKHH